MEVKYGHTIRTPGYEALAFKTLTRIGDPHLFAERLGDRCFGIGWY